MLPPWARELALGATLVAAAGCARAPATGRVELRFWAMGREGEVVQELVTDFERLHPEIHVRVQQIPWSAAHEKLLTGHVGGSTPDISQLGNTWIAEFSALQAVEPLGPWLAGSSSCEQDSFFSGIFDTNRIDGAVYGVPWYVDTRLIFYRTDLLLQAGYSSMPTRWKEWREAMRAIKRLGGKNRFAIFLPANEPTQVEILALQAGSSLLKDHDSRGAFQDPPFRRAFDFYIDLFREGLAPPVGNSEIANVYQEFAKGTFAMFITGPWNLGQFHDQLPAGLQDKWATAALPGPDGPAGGLSLAGGSSLVMYRGCRHKAEAWKLIEFLSEPQQQLKFYHLSGDLPARREAWRDTALSADPRFRAFGEQLGRAVSTPKIPEWENVIAKIQDQAESVIRGASSADSALAVLDREVNVLLEKRRWLLERRGPLGKAEAAEAR